MANMSLPALSLFIRVHKTTMKSIIYSALLMIAATVAATDNTSAQTFAARTNTFREKYKQDFLQDAHSPLKAADTANLRFFKPDSTYSVQANVEILTNQTSFDMATFNGSSSKYIRFAQLTFTLNGSKRKLVLYKSDRLSNIPEYQDYLFLPFTDDTNGQESYHGGRYIDMRLGDIQSGVVELDFNKAYNPYCAFSDGYQCPVPPQENYLNTKVLAGEKQYAGEKKHMK